MNSGCLGRHAAACLVLTLVGVLAMPPAWSAGNASWAGRVFHGDGITPQSGVVVSLLDGAGRSAAASPPTLENGAFVIDEAPAGDYRLAVKTPHGTFLSTDTMTLEPGANTPQALALQTGPIHAEREYGLGSEGLSRTTGIIIGVVIFVLGGFLLYEINNDDDQEPPGSPS